MNKEEKKYDSYETPKVRRIDVKKSKELGKMVYVTKDQEDVIYQDDAMLTDSEVKSKYEIVGIYIILQLMFYPFASFVSAIVMNKGEGGYSITFYIGASIIYALILILVGKFCFSEYEYGTFIKRCMLICGGQSLVLALFMILFIAYPMVMNIKYPDGDCFRITTLYSLVYIADILIQILLTYLEFNKKTNPKVTSIIMFLTQTVAIWLYALIVIPFAIKDNNERLIAYGIVLASAIILGIINVLINKLVRKIIKKGPVVIVINSRLEREKQIRKEERMVYYREHKKELIALAVISIVVIIGTIVACIIVSG